MITTAEYVSKHLPRHAEDAHKGNRGRVLIIGGSIGLTGAVCMASNAALKSGAGLITAAVPKSLNSIFEVKLTEIMTLPLDDVNGELSVSDVDVVLEFAKNCDAVAIGPGAGQGEGIRAVLESFVKSYSGKLIIDADALNVLAKDASVLENNRCDILITPHVGEMSRLIKTDAEEIVQNREKIARDFARKYGVNVLLKGKNTIITDGNSTYVNPTGNNGMAKGGSGDVLTGICVSLAAQGISTLESGVLGAYLHGMAGDFAKEKYTDYSMTPTDIIDNLGNAFKNLL